MNKLQKINHSRWSIAILFAGIFAFLLLCNALTTLAADDFSYSFSWVQQTRTNGIGDILGSLRVHYQYTNGRMLAHFFARLFLWLPPVVFKLCNTGIFTLLLLVMYRICKRQGQHCAILLPILFGLLWCMTPQFGEVYLWLDGACNYLWSGFFTLLYLEPLLRSVISSQPLPSGVGTCVRTLLLGFVAGAWLENASAAAIFMAVLLLVVQGLQQKKRPPLLWCFSVLLSVLGYLTLIMAPGEARNKYGSMSMALLRQNFMAALEQYRAFWVLVLIFGIFMILTLSLGGSKGRIWAALVLFAGSLAANFIFIFAAYYPPRAAFYSVLLLVLAIGVLVPEICAAPYRELLLGAVWALCLVASYQMLLGLNDIYSVHGQFRANEAIIAEAVEQGQTEVTAHRLTRQTPYAVITYYESDPTAWPNTAIARYYGLDSFVFQ